MFSLFSVFFVSEADKAAVFYPALFTLLVLFILDSKAGVIDIFYKLYRHMLTLSPLNLTDERND